MEARIARLEATTEHIQSDVKELRQDVKEIRQELKSLNEKLDGKFEALQKDIHKSFESIRVGRVVDRVWTLLAMGALLGVIARGFKWI